MSFITQNELVKFSSIRPTIVVIAYTRLYTLKRLLLALDKAIYPSDVRLIISIEKAENNLDILKYATDFEWKYGEKICVYQKQHLGLVNHFFKCCDLTQQFGPIILLEDDLFVSPVFYKYASDALQFYEHEEQVGGISLYTISRNGYNKEPFIPLPDESDIFFLQIEYCLGQAYNPAHWLAFRDWYTNETNHKILPQDNLPEMFFSFSATTKWFHIVTKYLVQNNKYFVFPRTSLSTNFGDIGEHFNRTTTYFQVPLQYFKTGFHFKNFIQSYSVYDSFFEILSFKLKHFVKDLQTYDFDVDLYGLKSTRNIKEKYVLTTKLCKTYEKSYGKGMLPLEMNIIEEVPGKNIYLCKKTSLKNGKLSRNYALMKNHEFYTLGLPTTTKTKFLFLKILKRFHLF